MGVMLGQLVLAQHGPGYSGLWLLLHILGQTLPL